MSDPPTVEIAQILPPIAREALVQAANLDPTVPFGESMERRIQIDTVIDRLKLQYPEFFRHNPQE